MASRDQEELFVRIEHLKKKIALKEVNHMDCDKEDAELMMIFAELLFGTLAQATND